MDKRTKEIKKEVYTHMRQTIWDIIAIIVGLSVLLDDTPIIIGYWWVVPVVMVVLIFMNVHNLSIDLMKLIQIVPKYIKLMDIDKMEDNE